MKFKSAIWKGQEIYDFYSLTNDEISDIYNEYRDLRLKGANELKCAGKNESSPCLCDLIIKKSSKVDLGFQICTFNKRKHIENCDFETPDWLENISDKITLNMINSYISKNHNFVDNKKFIPSNKFPKALNMTDNNDKSFSKDFKIRNRNITNEDKIMDYIFNRHVSGIKNNKSLYELDYKNNFINIIPFNRSKHKKALHHIEKSVRKWIINYTKELNIKFSENKILIPIDKIKIKNKVFEKTDNDDFQLYINIIIEDKKLLEYLKSNWVFIKNKRISFLTTSEFITNLDYKFDLSCFEYKDIVIEDIIFENTNHFIVFYDYRDNYERVYEIMSK